MLAERSRNELRCDLFHRFSDQSADDAIPTAPQVRGSGTSSMKRNPVKAALKAGQPQVGTWLSLGSMYATRVLARVGFPWLTVDMEHSPIATEQAANLFGAIAEARFLPPPPLPPGPHNNLTTILAARPSR